MMQVLTNHGAVGTLPNAGIYWMSPLQIYVPVIKWMLRTVDMFPRKHNVWRGKLVQLAYILPHRWLDVIVVDCGTLSPQLSHTPVHYRTVRVMRRGGNFDRQLVRERDVPDGKVFHLKLFSPWLPITTTIQLKSIMLYDGRLIQSCNILRPMNVVLFSSIAVYTTFTSLISKT